MIKFLEVKNFRNINYIKLEFQELCSILLGANGIGKSNTLNALNFVITHTLLTDKWGSGENDLNSIFNVNYVEGANPEVTITLDTGTTFTKKYVKGKNGNSAEYYINGVKESSKKNFEEALYKDLHFEKKLHCEKEVNEVRLFTDPLYALQKLEPKALRTLLVELGCSVSNDEVFELDKKFETLKPYRDAYRDDFTKFRASLKTAKLDLSRQLDAINLVISNYSDVNDSSFDLEVRTQLENKKIDILSQLNKLSSGNSAMQEKIEAEITEQLHQKQLYELQEKNKINGEIVKLEVKYEEAVNKAKSKNQTQIEEINKKIQEFANKITALNQVKSAYANTRFNKRYECQKYLEEKQDLISKIDMSKDVIEQIQKRQYAGLVTCPDCGKIFAPDTAAEMLFNKQKQDDINHANENVEKAKLRLKEIEKAFNECVELGKKAKVEEDKVDAELEPLKFDLDKLNQEKDTLVEAKNDIDFTEADSIKAEIDNLKNQQINTNEYDLKINNLKAQLENLITNSNNANKEFKERLNSQLEEIESQIKDTYYIESRIASKKEAQEQQRDIAAKLNETEYLLELVNSFIQTKIKLINNKAKAITGLDFVMLEDNLTNDGIKEVCYATVDGVEFGSVNTSQKIVVGIKFIERIKEILGHNDLPILADRLEGFDDTNKIKNLTKEQVICTVVGSKNQKEITII